MSKDNQESVSLETSTSLYSQLEEESLESLEQNDLKLKDKLQFSRTNKQRIPTKFFALGGIDEIGKNTYCLEHDDELIIIDAGIKFVNRQNFPGLNGVIPSLNYLIANQKKIVAMIVTHGHEDHIGGITYMLKHVNIPVIYSPIMASQLIQRKVEDHNLPPQNIVLYSKNSVFYTKHFVIDFYKVNHSIPDSFGVCIITPNGVVVASGDFRFDFASKEDKFDLQKISKIATRKVDLLLCESTNSEQQGFNESEKVVINELNNIISSAENRVIITFFSSNIGRIEEIFKIAMNLNKKIVILGSSIDANINASQKIGYLKIDEKLMIPPKDVGLYPDGEILIICTGSQGEETSALSSISRNKHPWIKLKPTDEIIFSSNVIPGNTVSLDSLINRLYKSGCNIYLNSPTLKIHSSGHATKLEQQLFVSLVNPKYIIPVHGETRMMKALARNCLEIGISKDSIKILSNGEIAHLLNGEVTIPGTKVDASLLYIDGQETTNEGEKLSQFRTQLGKEGVVAAHLFIDTKNKFVHIISPIANSGSFNLVDSIQFLKKLQVIMSVEIKNQFKNGNISVPEICMRMEKILKDELYKEKKQQPHIEILVTNVTRENLFKDGIVAKKQEETEDTTSSSDSKELKDNSDISAASEVNI